SNTTWEDVRLVVYQRENISQQLHEFTAHPVVDVVHVVAKPRTPGEHRKQFVCYCCGMQHSRVSEYRHKESICRKYGKIDHLAFVCRSEPAPPTNLTQSSRHNRLPLTEKNLEDPDNALNSVCLNTVSPNKCSPYTIRLMIEKEPSIWNWIQGLQLSL
ncbi:unnamed protein product, partial [Dicrocoelium dendriticum]